MDLTKYVSIKINSQDVQKVFLGKIIVWEKLSN